MKSLQEIREHLKTAVQNVEIIQSFFTRSNVSEQLSDLEAKLEQPNFWQAPDFVEVSKKAAELRDIKLQYENIIFENSQLQDLMSLFGSSTDENEIVSLGNEVTAFLKKTQLVKLQFLLSKKYDSNNCFLTVTPGAGGTESQDWADMLFRMYMRFCEKQGYSVFILDYQPAAEAGIKSATILIKGKNAYGLLRTETGIHRLVRISPFDSNKRRHTSFAAIAVSPEVDEGVIDIKPADLRIDTYRSGGAGGQHVNTTDSAVRITHIPTGIVAQCQNERSQHQNKQQALKILYSRIVEFEEQRKAEEVALKDKQKIEWGSQIRSYVLHPYKMVKDHRTDFEASVPEKVLDGDLEDFIYESLLIQS